MSNQDFYFKLLYPFQDQVLNVIRQVNTGFYLTGGTAVSQTNQAWQCQVLMKEERFARLNLTTSKLQLKIEMVNDVPARVGSVQENPILGRLDTAENILANKVTTP